MQSGYVALRTGTVCQFIRPENRVRICSILKSTRDQTPRRRLTPNGIIFEAAAGSHDYHLTFRRRGIRADFADRRQVVGEDGQPLKDALIKIERKDIKGNYKVKTKKKGDYLHAGLPLGNLQSGSGSERRERG